MNEIFYSSIFGELTKQVQIRIDAASELRKRLFDQNIYERFLDWDTPTVGLNFEELIGSYNLSVAAATLDSKGSVLRLPRQRRPRRAMPTMRGRG